jgi:LysM repeat protein
VENFERVRNDRAPVGWVAEHYSPVADNWSSATRYYCGTEMHHPGDSTPWPPKLIQLAVDLNAAMCIVGGWTANRCHMHAEHSARKIDMSYLRGQGGFDLRARIATRISGGTTPSTVEDELSAAEVKTITDAVSALSKRMDTMATEVWTKGITGTQAGGRANEMLAAILGGVQGDNAQEAGQTSALNLLTKVSRPMVLVRDTESKAGAIYSVGPGVMRRVTGAQMKAGVSSQLWGADVFPVSHADVSALLAWSQAPNGLYDDGGAVPPPPPPANGTVNYTVVAGDTLSTIASGHSTTVDAILALNPGITNPDNISVGQVIKLPKA